MPMLEGQVDAVIGVDTHRSTGSWSALPPLAAPLASSKAAPSAAPTAQPEGQPRSVVRFSATSTSSSTGAYRPAGHGGPGQ